MAVRRRRSTCDAGGHGQPGPDRRDQERSAAWSRRFEELTWPPDADEPIDPIDSMWDRFVTEGERLRDLVAAELGPDAEVVLDHDR